MSSAFNFDLNEDIKLAAEVEKYPCLYNRFDVRYKKEPHCEKAWEDVGEALGLDKGKWQSLIAFRFVRRSGLTRVAAIAGV